MAKAVYTCGIDQLKERAERASSQCNQLATEVLNSVQADQRRVELLLENENLHLRQVCLMSWRLYLICTCVEYVLKGFVRVLACLLQCIWHMRRECCGVGIEAVAEQSRI